MGLLSKNKGKTSTGAMREAAALLGKLREFQLVFLQHKRLQIETMVSETGGVSIANDQEDSVNQDAEMQFEDFWNG